MTSDGIEDMIDYPKALLLLAQELSDANMQPSSLILAKQKFT